MGSCCHWSAALHPHRAVICQEPITLLCFGEELGCAGAFLPAAPLRSLCSVCPQAGCESRAGSAVGALAVRALGKLDGCRGVQMWKDLSAHWRLAESSSAPSNGKHNCGVVLGSVPGHQGGYCCPGQTATTVINSCGEAKSPSSPECAGFKLSFYLFRKC